MILLSGHSLTQERRVPMEALSLQLKERDSTASMVPTDMTGINAESWFLDDVSPGGGIVYRVSGIQTSYTVATITVKLEHVINTLRDKVIFGEITPADITGNPNAERCSAEQAVRFILADQSDWRLGTFGYNVSDPYKFDGETLYDALVKISNSLEDCWWSYDMSQYPFVLNMTPKPAGVACELRPGRNLSAITKNVDKSGMYTRFYPVGKDDLHIPGEYVSRNEHLYGTVSKIEVDQSIDDPADLYEWAVERLKKHAEPNVNITADGIELADATGETLDRLKLGRICRIPLTEFDTIIEERIVGLDYSDKVHQPEKVRITMSNQKDDAQHDLVHVLASNIKATSKGQRTSTRQQKNDHAWIEDTNDHVALCAEGIVGVDAQGNPNWKILSQIVVDGTGIHQSVQEIQRGNVIRDTKIEQNERAITLEANNRVAADNELQGKITVEADRITQEVTQRKNGDEALSGRITVEANRITQEVTDRTNADSTLSGRITTEAGRITAEVTRAKGAEDVLSGRLTITENAITQEVTDRTNADSTLSGRITTEAGRITAEVTRATGAEETLAGRLTITENAITQEVTDRTNADSTLSGRITTEAGRITAEVTRATGAEDTLAGRLTITENAITQEVTDRTNADTTLDGRITVEAGKITQIVSAVGSNGEVTAASICLAINDNQSQATINADKIYLLGDTIANTVTANYISSKIATLSVLNVAAISASGNISTTNGYIMAPYYYLGTVGNAKDMANSIWALKIDGPTNNVYTLQKQAFGDTEWVDVGTFSRAIDSWTLGWVNGKFTAKANPQNDTAWTEIVQGTALWDGNLAYVPIEAKDSDNPNYQYATGRTVLVDATARYNAGRANADVDLDWDTDGVKATIDNVLKNKYYLNYQFAAHSTSQGVKYYLELAHSTQQGSQVISGTSTEICLGLSGETVQMQDNLGRQFSGTPTLQLKLHTPPTITVNATYTVPSGFYGFDDFVVDVDTEAYSYAFSNLGVQPNQGMPPTGYTYAGHVSRPSVNSFLVFEVKADNSQGKKKYYFEIG